MKMNFKLGLLIAANLIGGAVYATAVLEINNQLTPNVIVGKASYGRYWAEDVVHCGIAVIITKADGTSIVSYNVPDQKIFRVKNLKGKENYKRVGGVIGVIEADGKRHDEYNLLDKKTVVVKDLKNKEYKLAKTDIIKIDIVEDLNPSLDTTRPGNILPQFKKTFTVPLQPLRITQDNKTVTLVIERIKQEPEKKPGVGKYTGGQPGDYKITGWEGAFELVK